MHVNPSRGNKSGAVPYIRHSAALHVKIHLLISTCWKQNLPPAAIFRVSELSRMLAFLSVSTLLTVFTATSKMEAGYFIPQCRCELQVRKAAA